MSWPRPSIPLHLYAHEGRALTLSTQLSPRHALVAGAALLAARGVHRLVSSLAAGTDCSALDLLGAEDWSDRL